jgi:sugar (pentulose or hexulose) kinase
VCADVFRLPVARPPQIEAAALGGARQVRWAVDDVPVDAVASPGRRFEPTQGGAFQAGLDRANHVRDVALSNRL